MRGSLAVMLGMSVALGCQRDASRKELDPSAFILKAKIPGSGAAFGNALYQALGVRMVPGHEARWLDNGAVFDALEEDIRGARQSIHVVMYIWEKGEASDRIVAAITERAEEGVACRIVIDDFGSPKFAGIADGLKHAGCEVRRFRPLPGGAKLERNHRKLVIIDGRTAFTGGFGIRDEWLGDGVHDEKWRDANMRLRGPAVHEAQQLFAENWLETGGGLLPAIEFPRIEEQGGAHAAVIGSTASPVVTRAERLAQLLIASAHKRLWISNAYFVPSSAIMALLGEKAEKGVDVRILVAGKRSDSKTSFGVQHFEYGALSEKGAKVYEYEPSMLHSKTMLVDDALVMVGSVNLDPLSLNRLEEAAFLVEDRKLAGELARRFEQDCTHATER